MTDKNNNGHALVLFIIKCLHLTEKTHQFDR